jgi:hypothetical protein
MEDFCSPADLPMKFSRNRKALIEKVSLSCALLPVKEWLRFNKLMSDFKKMFTFAIL